MKQSTSKLLSALLVLCLVLALLPTAALAEEKVVYAGTPEELMAALGNDTIERPGASNVTVILEGKDYTVSEGQFGEYDYYYDLANLENVTIRGTEGTRLMSTSSVDMVVSFFQCKNVTLENLVLGHDVLATDDLNWAGIVYAFGTENLTIRNCEMFGGLLGIGGQHSTITVENSTIRDNAQSILNLLGSSVTFTDCEFLRNGYTMPAKEAIWFTVAEDTHTLAFNNCTFRENKSPRFSFIYTEDGPGSCTVENCTFANNVWDTKVAIPATGGSIYFSPETKKIVDCDDDITQADIPAAVDGVAVTGIETYALFSTKISSVSIPDSVTSIGQYAFYGCSSLKDVYYGGSESQWKQIEIDNTWNNNDPLLGATIHYNSIVPDAPEPPAPDGISVTVNGKAVDWTDVKPFVDENNRTMVPLRAVADAMDLDVVWNDNAQVASFIDGGGKAINFIIGSSIAFMSDGTYIVMDTTAVVVNDRTYAPIRPLAEYFGYTVGWDDTTQTVTIS